MEIRDITVGMRVQYVGQDTPNLRGRVGTVHTAESASNIRLVLDGEHEIRGLYARNLQPYPPDLAGAQWRDLVC